MTLSRRPAALSVALGAMILTPSQALAADWVYAASTATGFSMDVDRSSIHRSGDTVQYWQRTTYHPKNLPAWEKYVILIEGNCATGQSRELQITVFKLDGSVSSTESNPGQWTYNPPESISEATLKVACRL